MNEIYEKSKENLIKHIEWYKNKDRNEATTRLQLIDTLLFDCLGWDKKNDLTLENPDNDNYADYTLFSSNNIRYLIIEAKKEGIYFELPIGFEGLECKIKTLYDGNKEIENAIKQAMKYCQERGVPLGAVSNGHQIVCFIASRDDGISPYDGKAVVFDSLNRMLSEFHKFWDYLSKPGINNRKLNDHLLGLRLKSLPSRLSASIDNYPGFKNRNILQTDLQMVGELVIQDVTDNKEIETEFIKECYSLSGAISQYLLLSREILQNRYAALFDNKNEEIPALIHATTKKGIKINSEILADSFSNKPILILGDVGVGKTIFIKNLMKVEGVDLFKNSIYLYVDLGSQGALTHELKFFILREIERQLSENYEINVEDRNLVRGVYNLDLKSFSEGINKDLKEINPQKYLEKEIDFLEKKINNKEEHLKYTINHFSRGRKKQIIFILDNADQRDEKTQQEVFLIAQEFATHWPATVFVSIRPETFFKSKKSGTLSAYHTKAFLISPPRVDDVIYKRLEFAYKIANGEIQLSNLNSGIFLKLEKLKIFLKVLINSLYQNQELLEFIDNICTGNIRKALQLIIIFIGSGHINTKKILDIVETEKKDYIVPLHEFFRAIVYENNEYYSPEARVTPIVNILNIINPDPKEHFILMIIIDYTNKLHGVPSKKGFIESKILYSHLQDIGYLPNQIELFLNIAIDKNLLESEKKKESEILPNLIRVTSLGVYHLEKFLRYFSYIDAISVDIPVLDEDYRNKINNVHSINDRLDRAVILCKYLDEQWINLSKQKKLFFNWFDISNDLKNDINKVRIKANINKNDIN
jgi:hypothetical protein